MVDTEGIFSDLVFEFAIEGIPPLKLKKLLTQVQAQGGKIYLPGEAEVAECSHVVASNTAHPAAIRARDREVALVSLLWLVDSLKAERPLPHKDEPLYQPARAEGIPGAESCTVSITNLADSLRYAVLDMLNGMGAKVCLAMQPDMTTHIVAKDVDDPNSEKLKAARAARGKHKIRIVNVLWVYDCLRQRQILPAESYTSNPPPEMDPTQGKLAIEIWPQAIAATPESTPSPSAFGLEEGDHGEIGNDPQSSHLLPQRLESGLNEVADELPGAPTPAIGPATGLASGPNTKSSKLRPGEANGPQTKSSKLRPGEATPAVLTESAIQRKPLRGIPQPPETAKASSLQPVESRSAAAAENSGRDALQVNQEQPETEAKAGRDALQENQEQSETTAKAPASTGWRARSSRIPLTGVVPNLVQPNLVQSNIVQPAGTSTRAVDPATAQRSASASERVAVNPERGVMSEARQAVGRGRTLNGRAIRSACQWEPYEGENADAPQQSGNGLSGTVDDQEGTDASAPEATGDAKRQPIPLPEAARQSPLQGKALISSLHLNLQHDFESSSADCSEIAAGVAMAGVLAAQLNPSGVQGEPKPLDDYACALSKPAEPGNPPFAAGVVHRTGQPGASGSRAATGAQTIAAQPDQQASVVPGPPADGSGAENVPMGGTANGGEAGIEAGVSGREPADQSRKEVANGVLWKAQPLRRGVGSSAKVSSRRQVPPRRSGTQVNWRPLIGRRVSKLFDGVAYEGKVVRFNAKTKYFHITYDDDDSEDFSYEDLHSHLLPEGDAGEEPEVSSPPKASAEVIESPAPPQPDPAPSSGKREPKTSMGPLVSKRRKLDNARRQGGEQAQVASAQREAAEGGPADEAGKAQAASAQPEAAEGGPAEEAGKGNQQKAGRKPGGKAAKKRASRVTAAKISATVPGSDTKPPPAVDALQKGISRGGTPRSGAKPSDPRRALFAVSGMHRDEREQAADKMRALGLNMTADLESHKWDPRTTHLVMPCMLRCGKTLAAMAAGAWLLSDSYLVASFKARSLLEPEEYEMDVGSKDVSQGAPKHWRARSQLLGKRAFADLRILVHDPAAPGDRPSRDDILAIVKAGGGSAVTAKQALSNGADLCVTRRSKSDATVKQLLRAGVCIARPLFLVEWLAHPWLPLTQHLLYRSRMGNRLAAAVDERGEEGETLHLKT